MGLVIGAVVVAGALLFAAALLLKPPKGKIQGLGEDQFSILSTRGSWVPVYFGTRKTEEVLVGWVGNRRVRKESIGGGGKGGGGGDIKQNVYYEDVWHIISIGNPATALHEIRFNGKIVWSGGIDSATTPNGSTIDAGQSGQFVIWWGEANQPVATEVGDRTGVYSRHPTTMHILWIQMRLGSSPAHPQVEYVCTWSCEGSSLEGSRHVLDNGSSTGINPAHVIHALLSGGPFYGVALDADLIDNDSLVALGVLCEAEHLPVNMAISGGPEAARPLQALLQDVGVAMPQIDGRLAFIPQRYSADALPEFGDDLIVPPDISRELDHSGDQITRPVFTIDHEDGYNFRELDVPYNDDGDSSQIGLATAERIKIETATNIEVASKIANRRWQETTTRSSLKVSAVREARLLEPGQAFIRTGIGQVRIISKTFSGDSPKTTFDLALDSYAFPTIDDTHEAPPPYILPLPAQPDTLTTFFVLPDEFQPGGGLYIGVIRIRAHEQIAGAFVWASADGINYNQIGSQDAHGSGGITEEAMLAAPADIYDPGPAFETINDDIEDVLDLSGDVTSWQNGRQIAIINDEAFFVQYFEVRAENDWQASTPYTIGEFVKPAGGATGLRYKCTAAGTSGPSEPSWPGNVGDTVTDGGVTWQARRFAYTPRNMIRARYGTAAVPHDAGSNIFIMDSREIEPLDIWWFTDGQEVCVKTQPYTAFGSVSLADVTAVCKTIAGAGSESLQFGQGYRVDNQGRVRTTATGEIRVTSPS